MPLITRQMNILFMGTLLFGCATAQVPGKTIADTSLQNMVIEKIKQIELEYHCPTEKLTVKDTQITIRYTGQRAQEKWTVLSCNGENHDYEVNYFPSPNRELDAEVRKWPD